jgi:hypothetical protein
MVHVRAATVDPQQLVTALLAAGWTDRGGRAGLYRRLGWPRDERRSVLVPLDRDYGDFPDLMAAVLGELEETAQLGEDAAAVLALLAGQQPVVPDEPDPLDYAMWTVFLVGNWRWVTEKMTTEEREAAVAACMRYDRWMARQEGQAPHPRSHYVWWD